MTSQLSKTPPATETFISQGATRNVRSMTGQGHASSQTELGTFSVEVRTVNHRGIKCTVRSSDSLARFENRIETTARSMIHRGSVQLNLGWRRPDGDTPQKIDEAVLGSYYAQCVRVAKAQGSNGEVDIAGLIGLPGVLVSSSSGSNTDDDVLWQHVKKTLTEAIENLNQMRDAEGVNMSASLESDCRLIRDHVENIGSLAPEAVESYRERLESKVKKALEKHDINVQTVDLLREVQIYADRADISEEVTRLGSHLQLFVDTLHGKLAENNKPEPTGRKLDFIIQEMGRETNTIGSKANHSGISVEVVEIKCAIERMRELVQNIE